MAEATISYSFANGEFTPDEVAEDIKGLINQQVEKGKKLKSQTERPSKFENGRTVIDLVFE